MTLSAVVQFAGGVGLFLLGMHLMTEGMKVAAGNGLRSLLAHATESRGRAIGSGVAITALVQSSSAVTFATIGFVNAGLLALPQAIGVIYGANLGTTVTSWLVALVGFKFDLKILALPMVAVGMAMRVAFGSARVGALGSALAGFGVFFLGIDVLKEAFAGMGAMVSLGTDATMAHRLLPYVGAGFMLTLLMQSSSAALVITLSAAASGVIPLYAGAAMVIGANIGTTSTAVFAVIGATAAAKRAAAAHVLFNLAVAVVALVTLPVTIALVSPLDPATALAAFHTLTKVMGVAVMLPLTGHLTAWLERRFRSADEDAARPHYLDRNITATPGLALGSFVLELGRAQEMARRMSIDAVRIPTHSAEVVRERAVLDRLLDTIAEFAAVVGADRAQAEPLAAALRVRQYLADVGERAVEYVRLGTEAGTPADVEIANTLQGLKTGATAALSGAADSAAAVEAFEVNYRAVKATLLRAGAEARLPVRSMVVLLDQMSALRRLVDQAAKAAQHLATLRSTVLVEQ